MIYTYNDIVNEPKLAIYDSNNNLISGIHYNIINSDMIDKSIEWCRWDEDNANGELYIKFTNLLSQSDKAKLDTIVENNS